jgi:hypothetical protein
MVDTTHGEREGRKKNTMISAAASLPSQTSSSSIVVMHIDTSDMTPILKEAFGKNVEIATISNNGSVPAKYFYEGLQNYIEGTVADHTEDGVTPNKNNIGIVLKEILNDNLRTALMPFDRDGDGTIDAEELQQAAKDHQTVLMSRKILAWFSFALLLFTVIVCGGLSVGIYYIVFSMKDTYVNPSTGLMMVKAPDGSTDTNTAGIGIELPTRTLGQGVTITSQETMGGRTCYSSDSVANMFVNVATGVTTSLAETNQDTDELHIYHLGNSDCDESNIVWSNKDVQLGCVVMVPSLECTNMVRRGRYLSEFADTDAMQDRHRSLKEHVANMIVGATAIGQHGTTIDRSNRNLQDNVDDFAYINDNGSEAEVTWKKYDATDCKGAHTRINDSKSFGGGQRKWQTEYTVEEMLAECKSKCAEDKACVAFNFRDNREHEDYPFGGSSCKWWSTITDTPNAVGDSKDCWVSSKTNFGQTPNPTNSPSSLSSSSPSTNPTSEPTVAPTLNPTTQQPNLCEDTVADLKGCLEDNVSLRKTIADLKDRLASTDAPNLDNTSQCNADDEKLTFDTCRCNELSVLTNNVCSQVPVDCDNGKERLLYLMLKICAHSNQEKNIRICN